MKSKIKYILMVFLMPLLFSNQTYSQEEVVGSWIISSNYQPTNLGYKNYQLKFNKDGIHEAPIVLNEDENGNSSNPWNFVFSLGAYQFDGTLDLYFTNDFFI